MRLGIKGSKEALKASYERYRKKIEESNEESNEFRSSMKAKCDKKEEPGFTRIMVKNGCEIPCGTSNSLGFDLKPGIEISEPGELPPGYMGVLER